VQAGESAEPETRATEALEATASAAPWANRPRMSFQSTRLGRMRASESQLRHKSALMTSISMIQPQTTQVTGPLTHMTIITMPSRENMARMRAMSKATLPTPMTATSLALRSQVRGWSGCPSYQETKSAPP